MKERNGDTEQRKIKSKTKNILQVLHSLVSFLFHGPGIRSSNNVSSAGIL